MAYMALYRKYRPNTFSSVIGQNHIVDTLRNQITQNKISHAYLFCGTRGTGKTSCAKLFARAINCESRTEDGEPCNTCEMCRDILEGRSVNVIEIDAASNNKVEDVREIIDAIKYPPTSGKYKIYIIDEVHMLTASAFNALLKTLEEPPEYVIFILATTDPNKIPTTILSRCQRFDFRRITRGDIQQTLQEYIEKESQTVEEEAVRLIAYLGDGSMRDSLSILDQCLAVYGGADSVVTHAKVLDLLGAVDTSVFFQTTEALAKKDNQTAMQLVEQMMVSGRDIPQFISEYIVHLRNFLFVYSLKDSTSLADISKEDLATFENLKSVVSMAELLFFIEQFSTLQSEMKYTSNQRILLEVAVLKLCSPITKETTEALMARLAQMERAIEKGITVAVAQTAPTTATATAPTAAPEKKKRKPKALSEDKKHLQECWHLIRNEIESGSVKGFLEQTTLSFKEDDESIYLICAYEVQVEALKRNQESIVACLEKEVKKEVTLEITTKEAYDKWHNDNGIEPYGDGNAKTTATNDEDLEFESLMSIAIPDAEYEE
ncbi:MAG: DNA polymerase III subunit gamma/tau [Bacillota bacterium]